MHKSYRSPTGRIGIGSHDRLVFPHDENPHIWGIIGAGKKTTSLHNETQTRPEFKGANQVPLTHKTTIPQECKTQMFRPRLFGFDLHGVRDTPSKRSVFRT